MVLAAPAFTPRIEGEPIQPLIPCLRCGRHVWWDESVRIQLGDAYGYAHRTGGCHANDVDAKRARDAGIERGQ